MFLLAEPERLGLFSRNNFSHWSSPTLPVCESLNANEFRTTVDYTRVNIVVITPAGAMPDMKRAIPRVSGASYYARFDNFKGFGSSHWIWTVRSRPQSSLRMACTHRPVCRRELPTLRSITRTKCTQCIPHCCMTTCWSELMTLSSLLVIESNLSTRFATSIK